MPDALCFRCQCRRALAYANIDAAYRRFIGKHSQGFYYSGGHRYSYVSETEVMDHKIRANQQVTEQRVGPRISKILGNPDSIMTQILSSVGILVKTSGILAKAIVILASLFGMLKISRSETHSKLKDAIGILVSLESQ